MWPIHDQPGLEQGGPNSSELYKIYNNEQLVTAQESGFGASLSVYQAASGSGFQVASVGKADDTALVSNDIQQLSAVKTKLLLRQRPTTLSMLSCSLPSTLMTPPSYLLTPPSTLVC